MQRRDLAFGNAQRQPVACDFTDRRPRRAGGIAGARLRSRDKDLLRADLAAGGAGAVGLLREHRRAGLTGPVQRRGVGERGIGSNGGADRAVDRHQRGIGGIRCAPAGRVVVVGRQRIGQLQAAGEGAAEGQRRAAAIEHRGHGTAREFGDTGIGQRDIESLSAANVFGGEHVSDLVAGIDVGDIAVDRQSGRRRGNGAIAGGRRDALGDHHVGRADQEVDRTGAGRRGARCVVGTAEQNIGQEQAVGERIVGDGDEEIHLDGFAGRAAEVGPVDKQRVLGRTDGDAGGCQVSRVARPAEDIGAAEGEVHGGDVEHRQRQKVLEPDIARVAGRNLHGQTELHLFTGHIKRLQVDDLFLQIDRNDRYRSAAVIGAGRRALHQVVIGDDRIAQRIGRQHRLAGGLEVLAHLGVVAQGDRAAGGDRSDHRRGRRPDVIDNRLGEIRVDRHRWRDRHRRAGHVQAAVADEIDAVRHGIGDEQVRNIAKISHLKIQRVGQRGARCRQPWRHAFLHHDVLGADRSLIGGQRQHLG